MEKNQNYLADYFGVLIKGQTYLNLIYLFLAFPLGLFYFVSLVTGFSLGIGLLVIFVGIFILGVVLAGSWALTAFERAMAIWFLKEKIGPLSPPGPIKNSLIEKFSCYIRNPVTWKGIVYLFLKFPIGVFTFVATTVGLTIPLTLLAVPFVFWFLPVDFFAWRIHTLPEALGLAFLGALLLPLSFHIFNWISKGLGKFSAVMLGNKEAVSEPPVPAVMVEAETTA